MTGLDKLAVIRGELDELLCTEFVLATVEIRLRNLADKLDQLAKQLEKENERTKNHAPNP